MHWTDDELDEIFDRIDEQEPPFSIEEVLAETRLHLIRAGLIIDRVERRMNNRWRKVPTVAERERYHAVKGLRSCPECLKIRAAAIFMDDGVCRWCHGEMNPDIERKVRDDRKFVRWFERRYLTKNNKDD